MFFPEVAITVSLPHRYAPKDQPRSQFRPQVPKVRKDNLFLQERRAETSRHNDRYETESTSRLPRSDRLSRSNHGTSALRERVHNEERLLALQMDRDHYADKKRRRETEVAELEGFADELLAATQVAAPVHKKRKSHNRGLDNRKAKAAVEPAVEQMSGRSLIYFSLLALALMFICLRMRTPAQESRGRM